MLPFLQHITITFIIVSRTGNSGIVSGVDLQGSEREREKKGEREKERERKRYIKKKVREKKRDSDT